jgi:UDP-N-acetylglucosamine acyltransferase
LTDIHMQTATIHPTAIVEEGAVLGARVCIEPLAIVKGTVTLGDDVVVKSHAYIDGHTSIGAGTVIYPGACIGMRTQDLKYRGEKTFVEIGSRCHIRECVTINASCQENTVVKIGDDCLIMAYCHVAHNCTVGNRVIMSNNATLAGHVTVEDYAIIGGMTPIHQYARIGRYAMVGGASRIGRDIPPYFIGGGVPFRYGGINIVGLKRHGFSLEKRQLLTAAFQLLFRSGVRIEQALAQLEAEYNNVAEIMHIVDFCRATRRGITTDERSRLPEESALESF